MRWIVWFCFFVAPVLRADDNAPSSVLIQDVTASGTGCPGNAVFASISPDTEVVTLTFDQFVVEKNGATQTTKQSKFCNLSFRLQIPENWAYALFSVDLEGAADLQEGIVAKQELRLRQDSRGRLVNLDPFQLVGLFQGNYQRTQLIPIGRESWKGCGRDNRLHYVELNTEISVGPERGRSNSASGFMSLDQVEGALVEKLGIVWRPCDRPGANRRPWIARCVAQVSNGDTVLKQEWIRAQAKTQQEALDRAHAKAADWCNAPAHHGSCSVDETTCSVSNLDR